VRELVEEYVDRGKANALIVTGLKTGEPPPLQLVRLIKKHSPIPVLVGSGVTLENLELVLKYSDGVIVGSYIKKNGKAGNPLDQTRAKMFIDKVREITK
jgi:Predicted TIM-barrel enzyme